MPRVNGDAGTMGDSIEHSAKLFASRLTCFYVLYCVRAGTTRRAVALLNYFTGDHDSALSLWYKWALKSIH